jgi:hypothetical protein
MCGEKNISSRFCYDCFIVALPWAIGYEAVKAPAHLGIQDRDLTYEQKCNCNHCCLPSLIQQVKVGDSQNASPNRWIDQGANKPFQC